MAKIHFDIKFRPQIESGEYKVETKYGDKVEILRFGLSNNDYDIVGIITRNNSEEVITWTKEGCFFSDGFDSHNNLVLITPEPELTDFEKKVASIILCYSDKSNEDCRKYAKDEAPRLLDAARKTLEPEIEERLDKAYHNQDEVVAFNAFEECAKQIKKKLDGYRLITFNQLRLIIDKLVEDARKKYLGGK